MAIVSDIISSLNTERNQLVHSLKRAEIAAHLFTLHQLNKKLRVKYIHVEDRFQDYNFNLSINEMDAYLLILYRDYSHFTPEKSYHLLTMQQISEPIFKHLLS